jgi:type II secretory pathway component PulF
MTFEFPTIRFVRQAAWPRFTTRSQQKSLLRVIAVASEQRLPLLPLVEALEQDERGRQKWRLRKLRRALQHDTPLPDALEQVAGLLDDEDALAIRFGFQSGTLPAAVRERLDAEPLLTPKARVGLGRMLFYLGVLILLGIPASMFLQVFIIPQIVQIHNEYDFTIGPPVAIGVLQSVGHLLANLWPLWLAVLVGGVWVVLSDRARRYLRRVFAGSVFHPLRQWRMAATLDELGVATDSGRPLPGVISTLARHHYDPYLRHKLLYVRNELEQGASLWRTLVATKFLTSSEVEALDAADRLGNRGWVLEQIANLRRTRVRRRLERLLNVMVLVLIFLLGAFVLLHAVAVFRSLTLFVTSLS